MREKQTKKSNHTREIAGGQNNLGPEATYKVWGFKEYFTFFFFFLEF